MHLLRLGHVVIVNNVGSEMPGSNVDVAALKAAYERVGFEVHVHQLQFPGKQYILTIDTILVRRVFI